MSRFAGIALAVLAMAVPASAAPAAGPSPSPSDSWPENPSPAEVTGNSGFEYPGLGYGSWIAHAENYPNFYWQESTGCGVEVQNNVAGAAYAGYQFTEIASNCPANVFQTVATAAGTVYTFGFAYSGRPGVQRNDVEVFFNGQSLIYLQVDTSSYGQTSWTPYTFSVTGTGSDTIRFVGRMPAANGGVGGYIDDVYLVPSGAHGDPQFTGFMGQSYQVHGTSGQVYNILSTPTFQYNALFSYLDSGKPRKGTQAFSHPGNYFGAVGVQIKDATGADNAVQITAGSVSAGLSVMVNNQTVLPSAHEFTIGAYTMSIPNEFEVLLESEEYNLRIQNSDMFLNQDVSIGTGLMAKIAAYKKAVKNGDANAAELKAALPHGILGQSWNTATYDNRWKHIQGQLYDYQVADGLMGEEFRYNKF